MIESAVERLSKANPDAEIWWDSSPLVYNQWAQKMIDAAKPDKKPVLEQQLRRLYNPRRSGSESSAGVYHQSAALVDRGKE